jgi:hypothetical protein
VLAARAKASLLFALAIGLMLAPPARADELAELDSLESSVVAAGELVQLPTEADWGVPDPSSSIPAVPEDAPAVPPVPAETPPEPRYHAEEPQYHAEYQAPAADPAPSPDASPAAAPPPTEPPSEPSEPPVEAETAPSEPVSAPAPTPAEAPASPTIWIWMWNWTWFQGGDERYQNFQDQYQIDESLLEEDLATIIESIETQIPVRIDIKTTRDITDEIVSQYIPIESPGEESEPPLLAEPENAPPAAAKQRPRLHRTFSPRPIRLERAFDAPLTVASLHPRPLPSARPDRGKEDKAPPRVRRASRGSSDLPRPAERFADSAAASGGAAASVLKTIAILALSLLLAAFGYGRRIWLPASRWRGLLGSRTDPPG